VSLSAPTSLGVRGVDLTPNEKKGQPGFARVPPRPPIPNGIVVAFGPASKKNTIITAKCALPLTPASIQIQAGGNWTDGIYPVRGDERSQFAGAMLENISFSARLEPPEFYVVNPANYGSTANAQQAAQAGISPPPPLAGYVLGSYDSAQANNEYNLQTKYFGGAFGSAPPVPGGNGGEIVAQPGGIAPAGYQWHEPHDFCALLEASCNAGEYVRLIIGDQYMVNCIISIRTFTWYYEDPDPDVINFDLTARGHRVDPTTPKPKTMSGTYTTQAGDTLYSIGAQYSGGGSTNAAKIFQYNVSRLASLWLYPDPRATASKYFVAKSGPGYGDSVGPYEVGVSGGQQLKKIRYFNVDGLTQFTYLREGISLRLTAPPAVGAGVASAALTASTLVGSRS
jgi:hypothetical protein